MGIQTWLDGAAWAALDRKCAREGITRAEGIRRAVRVFADVVTIGRASGYVDMPPRAGKKVSAAADDLQVSRLAIAGYLVGIYSIAGATRVAIGVWLALPR